MSAPDLLQRLARFFLLPLSSLSNRLGNGFYVGLAIVVCAAAAYAIASDSTSAMKHQAYDLIMKTRFQHPAADPEIVIVDIDEAALAAMAPEYGRWPWPRNIMGELVEGIARQKPRAIMFDIVFSDPDVFNLDGDRYFLNVITATPESFFPMIRLPAENDRLSQLKLRQLPGVERRPAASDEATLAAVVPYFYAALTDRRLGTINIEADADGIARNYEVHADRHGWRVYSLAANVAQSLGASVPDRREILINWRGKPPSYRRVSFHDVYFDLLKQKGTRAPDEFRDRIVIIGSTAPTLFDLKATPLAKAHPGVEILATALDNLKNRDYLRELPPWIYIAITFGAVVILSAAFVYKVDQKLINLVFTVLQTAFLAVSYLTLNFSVVFVDLTAPFAFSLAYFTVARINYMLVGYRRSGQAFFSTLLDKGNRCRVVLAQCHIGLENHRARLALGAAIKHEIGHTRYGLATAPFFKGMPLLHAFFRDTVVLYWLAPEANASEMMQDVVSVMERSLPAVRKARRRHAPKDGATVTWLLHAFAFTVDAEESWRLKGEEGMAKLFALTSKTGKGGGADVVRVIATKEFLDLVKKTDGLSVSDDLKKGGLKNQ